MIGLGLFIGSLPKSIPVQVQQALGYIFNTFPSDAPYNQTGTGTTWTFTGDGLTVSGGDGSPGNFQEYNYSTGVEDYTTKVRFLINSSTGGLGVGQNSSNGKLYCKLNFLDGKIAIQRFRSNAVTEFSISATGIAYSLGDTIEITLTRKKSVFTATAKNTTTPSEVSASYTDNHQNSTQQTTWAFGKIAIYHFSGDAKVLNHSFYVFTKKKNKLLIIGDSITAGEFAGSNEKRYGVQLMNYAKESIDVLGGGGNNTQHIIDALPQIISLTPSAIAIMIGTNDAINNITQATFEANVNNIITQCTNNGIAVYIGTIIPTTNATYNTKINSFNTFINGLTSVAGKIDYYTALASGGILNAAYDSGDGTHPNGAGNDVMYNTLKTGLGSYITAK